MGDKGFGEYGSPLGSAPGDGPENLSPLGGRGFGAPPGDRLYTEYPSPLGLLTLAGEGDFLTGLWLEGQRYFGGKAFPAKRGEAPVFQRVRLWLDRYFAGEDPGPTPPLAPAGTPFQREVWALLGTVPYGQTTTYGLLAQRLAAGTGRRTSPRAVGAAVGHNPISILIPCHRVLGADGSLTGYAGGVERKLWLLQHEKIM